MMYRRNGCEAAASVCFIGLEFTGLEPRQPGEFSATLRLPWGRLKEIHTLTLDFDLDALLQLLHGLPESARRRVVEGLQRPAGETVRLPQPVRARVVECEPGEVRRLDGGTAIVPFHVTRLEPEASELAG